MTEDRIIGVKFSKGGLTGMKLTYERSEVKGNIRYNNDGNKNIKWPIQGELLRMLERLNQWLPKVRFDYGGTDMECGVHANGWTLNGDKILLTGTIEGDMDGHGSRFQGFTSFPIGPDCVYYVDLSEHIKACEELIRDYITTKAQLDTRQMVMDLFNEGKIKGTTATKSDVEKMSDAEALQFAKDTIEKHGGFVMDIEDEEPEEEPAAA